MRASVLEQGVGLQVCQDLLFAESLSARDADKVLLVDAGVLFHEFRNDFRQGSLTWHMGRLNKARPLMYSSPKFWPGINRPLKQVNDSFPRLSDSPDTFSNR